MTILRRLVKLNRKSLLTWHGLIEHGCSVEPGEQPIEPNPEPIYPVGQIQIGPLALSTQLANGWQKFCLEQTPVVPPSEGIARVQYLPSPCHPAGQDPQW